MTTKNNTSPRPKRQPKVKPVPTIATRTFESFEEAITNMRSSCNIIDSFFGEGITTEQSADEYVAFIAKAAAEAYPQLLEKYNIHTSYHIAANRVSVRGEHDLQFGWEFKYSIVEGKAVIEAVNCTIIMYNTFTALKEALTESGWELVEKKTKATV